MRLSGTFKRALAGAAICAVVSATVAGGLAGTVHADGGLYYPLVETGGAGSGSGTVTFISGGSETLATIVLSNALPNTTYTVSTSDQGMNGSSCSDSVVVLSDGSYAILPSGMPCNTSASAAAGSTVVTTDATGSVDVTVALPTTAVGTLSLTSSTGDTYTAEMTATDSSLTFAPAP